MGAVDPTGQDPARWSNSRPCSVGQTPASVLSRSPRQQVTPEQPAKLVGSWFQVVSFLGTNRMPVRAARSSIGRRPG